VEGPALERQLNTGLEDLVNSSRRLKNNNLEAAALVKYWEPNLK
jgi:hypothetical protein